MTSADAPPPVVCTLSSGALAEQQLEWADLAPLATTHTEVDGGVASTYPLELADQIEALAGREIACCGSWLQIAHERADNELRLRLTTTNPEGLGVIRSLSGL